MSTIAKLVERMRRSATGIRFRDLCQVCKHYFGECRQRGGSHRVYRTPWSGDPRVNIQNDRGMAKAHQVRQVLKAIDRLEADDDARE
jgi:hypothetical protein